MLSECNVSSEEDLMALLLKLKYFFKLALECVFWTSQGRPRAQSNHKF